MKSLASLATAASTVGTVGTALGVAAAENPMLLVWVPLGIVLAGPVLGAGVVGFEATVYRLRHLLGLSDDDGPPDAE